MERTCAACSMTFAIREQDLPLYERVSPVINGVKEQLPMPTRCPNCRQMLRYAWRNIRSLYQRPESREGKMVISAYPPETPFPIYEYSYWWSDQWDPLEYGRDVDFSRPFFEQYNELLREVPRSCLINDPSSENSPFVLQTAQLKNCYMVFNTESCEDTYYAEGLVDCRNTLDAFRASACERCYEVVEALHCYNVCWGDHIEYVRDSAFVVHCRHSHDCFGTVGVEHGAYLFFNEQLTPEVYYEKLASIDLRSREVFDYWKQKFLEHRAAATLPTQKVINCENVTGDYLYDSKNLHQCFDLRDAENCLYCTDGLEGFRDSIDVDVWGHNIENIYGSVAVGVNASNVYFSSCVWENVRDIFYSDMCFTSHDLFGCTGLRGKSYCILNKQYSKEEYETLVPRIIESMRSMGEWGEFFPLSLSPHAYNETIAQDYHPKTLEQVEQLGGHWLLEEAAREGELLTPPDTIEDTVEILDKTYTCADCKKVYKFVPQELAFLLERGLPLPTNCWKCRLHRRFNLRRPRNIL